MEELKEKVRQILASNAILNKEQCEKELAELLGGKATPAVIMLIIEAYNQGVDVYYASWKKQQEEIEELNRLLDRVKDRVFNQFLVEP